MSLQARVTALAQAIGLDIKAIRDSSMPMDYVPAGVTKVIPAGFQMPVYGALEIDGVLDVQGKLVMT